MRLILILCLVVLASCSGRKGLFKSRTAKAPSETGAVILHVPTVGSISVPANKAKPDKSVVNKAIEYLKISQEEGALPKRAEPYCSHGYSLVGIAKSEVSRIGENEWQVSAIFGIRCVDRRPDAE